jgi:membrane-associated phospholipid phosphatase
MISTDTTANVTPKLFAAHGSGVGRLGRASAGWAGGYLAVSAAVLLVTGHQALAALHVVLLCLLVWSGTSKLTLAGVVWTFAPLVIVIGLAYGEVPTLVSAFAVPFHDQSIQQLEAALFGTQPAQTFAGMAPNVLLSELLHAGYMSFYLAISIPLVVLYVRRRREAFDQTMLALIVIWVVCCALFVAFPVQGPRFLWASPPEIPNGPFRWLSRTILAAGSARGTAFPSLHMAASVSQTIMAWRWQRSALKYGMTASTMLVATGAVYAGYHYATDIIAGGILGAVTTAVVIAVQGRRSASSASA